MRGWDIHGLLRENDLAGHALASWGLSCFAAFASGDLDYRRTHEPHDRGIIDHGCDGPRFVILAKEDRAAFTNSHPPGDAA